MHNETMMDGLLELLQAPARQSSSLQETAHRPWPLREGSWLMGQTWGDLLFAHWRVDAARLRSLLPAKVEVDEHDGSAWLGVTPFRVSGLRLRGTPPLPRLSEFLELNVRTYVTHDDRPGIWFFSLDAASRAAVEAARLTYHLPYFHARMECSLDGDRRVFDSARLGTAGTVFSARYRPTGAAATAEPGSLEHFLVERYCLYTQRRGRLERAEIHHRPWQLAPAEAEIELNTMAPVELPDDEPLLHFSERQDVVVWGIEQAA
jgi:uncharacterized protein